MNDQVLISKSPNNFGKPISRNGANFILPRILRRHGIRARANDSTHILRKTFGRRIYDNAGQSNEALFQLMMIFNHTSPQITLAYIGITAETNKTYIFQCNGTYQTHINA